jgi:endoglucanase
VRETNPNRTVFIGPDEWNSIGHLKTLRLPMDRNIIVMVHNYDPMAFTHQGIEWMPQYKVGAKCCDDAQRKQIADALEAARKWNDTIGYPVYLGEFGSYEKADMQSRATYTRIVRDEAEKRGIGWAYWEFASSFGVYNPKAGQWIEPLRRALLD